MVIKKAKFNIPNVIPWLKFLFIFLPVCKPYTVQQIDVLDDVFDIWGLLVLLLLLFQRKFVVNLGGIKKYVVVLCTLYVIFTLFNTNDVKLGAISEVVRILILPVYFMGITTKKQFISVCQKICAVYILLIIIDCLTIIWVNMGHLDFYMMDDRSFLGADNFVVFLLLPMFGTIHIISNFIEDRIKIFSMILFGICLAMKIYTFSLTAVGGMLAYAFLILVWKKKQNGKYDSYFRLITVVFCVAMSITLFASYLGLAELASSQFGKLTLFSRLTIWANTLNNIPQHLLIGMGKYEGPYFRDYISLPYGYVADHVHNSYLAVVFKWGIWGPVIFYKAYKYLISQKNKDELYILLSCIISIMIIGTFEDYYMVPFFFILFFVYDEKRKYEDS